MEAVLAGHRTHWRTYGEGPETALSLHCALAHSGAWAGLGASLPKMAMTAIDFPGHGRSADWDGISDFHGCATAVTVAMIERMGAPQHLIGHSFGATVALRVALERPDLVSRLTLIEPVLFCAAGEPALGAYRDLHRYVDAQMRAGDLRGAAIAFQSVWGAGPRFEDTPESQQRYITERIHLIGAQFPVLVDDAAGMLAAGRLEGLRIPILLLRGERSPPIIDAIAARLAQRLTDVRRRTIAGAGHMAPITHPQAVADAMLADPRDLHEHCAPGA